jgi:hypothetical protein
MEGSLGEAGRPRIMEDNGQAGGIGDRITGPQVSCVEPTRPFEAEFSFSFARIELSLGFDYGHGQGNRGLQGTYPAQMAWMASQARALRVHSFRAHRL